MFDIYTILPLTCALFVAFFGFFVLFTNVKSRMNQLMFGFCLSMFFWMFGTFMMFATRGINSEAVFWDRFVYAGVVFMPPFMHHFSMVFTGRTGQQRALLVTNYILALLSLIASRTAFFVDDIYYYDWGVHTKAQILHHVFLGYFFLGTGLFFRNIYVHYKRVKDKIARLQSIYVFLAFAIVIFIGGSAYLFAYGIDTKFPFAYVTGLIFPVMLFYAVSRHHLMEAKIVVTEVLVGLTEFLVVMQLFFSRTVWEVFIRVIISIVVALIGVLLIRSAREEIKRREETAELARSLEQANLRLKELDQQKTEFLSIASHQLRTPLSILKGYIELIKDGAYGRPTKSLVEVLDNMDSSNERLVKLVDEFLNVTRIEQGRTKFNFEKRDLNEIVASVIKELQEKADEKCQDISWTPCPGAAEAFVDEEKIRNVVFNYVDNALKYSDCGSVKVVLKREGAGWTIGVKDRGIGFSKSDESRFFQKFYRGENVKDINVKGTGLGLYVCRKFIEAHSGRVWARSPGAGKGSEFWFWIPVERDVPLVFASQR